MQVTQEKYPDGLYRQRYQTIYVIQMTITFNIVAFHKLLSEKVKRLLESIHLTYIIQSCKLGFGLVDNVIWLDSTACQKC